MAKISQGHKIICDGKFRDKPGDQFTTCGVELHPDARLIINKVGVLGHHCEFCHDPGRTVAAAVALGIPESTLREKYSLASAEKAVADKIAADKAIADKAAAEKPGK